MSALTDIFTDIANSLRSKMGTADTFKPNQMAGAINNISTDFVVNWNGTYVSDSSILYRFNTNVTVANGVTSLKTIFFGLPRFNGKVTIPRTVTDMDNCFANCYEFNQPVKIGSNVTNMRSCFINCYNFNKGLIWEDGRYSKLQNFSACFGYCRNYNQPTYIPDNVTDLSDMFSSCWNFNSIVDPQYSKATTTAGMFYNCYNYNQPINFPSSLIRMGFTFGFCTKFNQRVNIPAKVTDVTNCFRSCNNFGNSICFLNSSNISQANARNMCALMNNSLRKNIFCTNATPFIGTSASSSIVGAAITWSTMTNGYYNSTYNIYIYNNRTTPI